MILPAIALITVAHLGPAQLPVDKLFQDSRPISHSTWEPGSTAATTKKQAASFSVAVKPKKVVQKKKHRANRKAGQTVAHHARVVDSFSMPPMTPVANRSPVPKLATHEVRFVSLNFAPVGVRRSLSNPEQGSNSPFVTEPSLGFGAPPQVEVLSTPALVAGIPLDFTKASTPAPQESASARPIVTATHAAAESAFVATARLEPTGKSLVAHKGDPILDPLCSISASQEEPGKILQILSQQTHANLMLLAKPDARLTVRLTNVPLSTMIRHICAMSDLDFLKVGETYVIATPDKLKSAYPADWDAAHPSRTAPVVPEAVRTTSCYRTNFVNASQIAEAIGKLIPDKLLTVLSGPQSLSPDLGQQSSSQTTGTATNVLTKSATDADKANIRTLIMNGPEALVAEAMAIAKQLDQPRTQVAISVKVNDISNDVLKQMGLSWSFGNLSIAEAKTGGLNFGKFNRSGQTFSATLDALENDNKAKLLAAPSISVLDGERAFVLIGNRINYPVLVGYSQNNAPIFSKEEERVGIYLQVAVSVSSDDTVTLSLYPQVSSITGYLNVNGASYPQISTREAQSTLSLKSGESLVMGGLFKDETIDEMQKVPILGDIPFLRELFRHRKTTKTASQVIITVTPTIIKPNRS